LSKSDEYQSRAEECQRMANAARTDRERRSWIEMAESWLRMIPQRAKSNRQKANDAFEAEVKDKGTGQKRSDKSN